MSDLVMFVSKFLEIYVQCGIKATSVAPRLVRHKDSNRPELFWTVLKSRNTIYLSQIKAFFSTFEENPKFLFFYSPNLFVNKLTSSSTASSTIFKYFKSQQWCLLKISSSSVILQPHPEALCLRMGPVKDFNYI